MKIGLFSTFMSPIAEPDMIRNFAQSIEAMGVESLWMGAVSYTHLTLPTIYSV